MDYSLLTDAEQMEKRDSWSELRASLDADTINPDVVHQENYYADHQERDEGGEADSDEGEGGGDGGEEEHHVMV